MSQNGHFRDDGRRSDLAVMEANEYKQKDRLREILDAHKNVEEAAAMAWDEFARKKINRDGLNIVVQKAVQRAIRESYNLLITHAREVANASENGQQARDRYWLGDPEKPLGTIEFVERDPIVIVGLRDFLRTDVLYTEHIEEENDAGHGAYEETVVRPQEQTVPASLSWDAYLRLKEFLSQHHGLEIQFEQIETDAEADPF